MLIGLEQKTGMPLRKAWIFLKKFSDCDSVGVSRMPARSLRQKWRLLLYGCCDGGNSIVINPAASFYLSGSTATVLHTMIALCLLSS